MSNPGHVLVLKLHTEANNEIFWDKILPRNLRL
jgi:hypothetical protein